MPAVSLLRLVLDHIIVEQEHEVDVEIASINHLIVHLQGFVLIGDRLKEAVELPWLHLYRIVILPTID